MESIKERAMGAWADYEYRSDYLYRNCFIDGFTAGAASERNEFIRWRDPHKEQPTENQFVIVKMDAGIYLAYHIGRGEFLIQNCIVEFMDPLEVELWLGAMLRFLVMLKFMGMQRLKI